MIFRKIILIIIALPILLEGTVNWTQNGPEGFSVNAEFSSNELSVEDLLKVTLTLNYPDSYQIDSNQLQSNLLHHTPLIPAPFSLVDNHQERHLDHLVKETFFYTLQPQLPGSFSLTFYAIQFVPKSSQDKPVEIISDIVTVNVAKPSAESLEPIKPLPLLTFSPVLPIEISDENKKNILENSERQQAAEHYNQQIMKQSTLPWLEILLAFLVVALLLAIRYAPSRAKKPKETAAQRINRLHKESMQKLDALHQQKLLDQHRYIPFYVGVAETMRTYVDEKYHLNTVSSTTQEFVKEIETHPILDPETQKRLQQLFLQADRVKFSREAPTLEECKAAEQTAKKALNAER